MKIFRGRTPHKAVPFAILTVSLLLACFAFLSTRPVSAVPSTMNFQGRLADATGTIVPDGLYNMQFRLYTVSTGGTATWTETRETTNRVQVTNGLFSTQLGAVTPITASLFSGNDVYFEITMPTPGTATCNTASCASWESPMTPRHQMSTSAYAFSSDTLDGLDSAAFGQVAAANTWTNTNIVSVTDANAFKVQNASSLAVLTADTSASLRVQVGSSTTDATAVFFLLDQYNQASDPTGVEGAMYYNTNSDTFRCFQNSAWTDCIGSGGSGANTTLSNLGSTNINAALNTTSGNLTLQTTTSGNIILNAVGTTELQDDTNVGGNLTLAAAKSLTIVGGNTASRPGSPTEGMVYFDSDTDQLLTYANGKWQADRSDAVLVAASNSSAADKAAADYVADGNTGTAADGDQVQINSALTAGAGKKVVLLAGTYTVDAGILVPSNTVLSGVGVGSVITLPNSLNTDIEIIRNTDWTNGNSDITIRDLKIDGNSANNSSGAQAGVYMYGGSSVMNRTTISTITVTNLRNDGITLERAVDSKVLNNYVAGVSGAGSGISFYSSAASTNNLISGNNIYNITSSGGSIYLETTDSIITTNKISSGTTGSIYIQGSRNKVTSNVITDEAGVGIYNQGDKSQIENNLIREFGGGGSSNGIVLTDGVVSRDTRVINNTIFDSTGSGYAIAIEAGAEGYYLSGNTFSGAGGTGINDLGTGTVFANQSVSGGGLDTVFKQASSTSAFEIQNASSDPVFSVDTTDSIITTESLAAQTVATVTKNQILSVVDGDNTSVGNHNSLALGSDGFARISYYDSTNQDLKFAQCTDADCTTSNKTSVDTTGDVGQHTSLALGSDGFARISYLDNTTDDLKFVQCTNAACTTSNITSVDTTGNVGQYNSLALGSDGFARISYFDSTNYDLKFVQCTNAACTTSNITSVDTTGNVGFTGSLDIASDGFARISYYDTTNQDLKFAQCTNAACTTKNITSVDTTGDVGILAAVDIASDGFARIAYIDTGTGDLKFAQCTNAACTTSNITSVDTIAYVGGYATTMTIASDGFARISYYDTTNKDIKFAQCTNAACTTNNIEVIDVGGMVGNYSDMTIASDGFARISYNDNSNRDLKFARLTNSSGGTTYTGSTIGSATARYGQLYATSADLQGRLTIDSSFNTSGPAIDVLGATSVIRAVSTSGSMLFGVDNTELTYETATANTYLNISDGGYYLGNYSNDVLDSYGGSVVIEKYGVGTGLYVTKDTADSGAIFEAADDYTTVMAIGTGGATAFKNSADSTSAFKIQNTANLSLFNVNTSANNIALGAGTSLTLTGGNTASRPASPVDGMMYYDSDTDQMLTYTGGKWKADGAEAILVAANNSSAADKASADYIADGTDDQVQINAALTSADPAGSGRKTGKVYLFGGTYTTHQTNNTNATILVPNNTTLAGAGAGTVIRLGDIDATDNLIENTDKTTGTGVTIRDLKIDGQDTSNGAGSQSGIYFDTIGNGTTQGGKIVNVDVKDFRDIGIVLDDADNSIVERTTSVGSTYGISISWGSTNNTITGNKFQSNSSTGMYLNDGTHNNITSNNLLDNGSGGVNFEASSQFNTFTGNSLRGNGGNSIRIASSYNTVTGNIVYAGGDAIDFVGATYNTVSGNNVDGAGGSGVGFRFESSSNNNTVTGNNFRNTGGSTTNNAIYIDASDGNVISNNGLTDGSCSSNCYAINIFNSTSDNTYLSGNAYNSPATINDAGTGTVFANQSKTAGGLDVLYKQTASTTAFQIQNASAAALLTADSSSTNNRIQIGSSTTDATAIYFMLDKFNSGTEPTGDDGAMYYNTNLNKFRCFQGAWTDCITTAGASTNLSNLTSTAINQSLVAGSNNSIDIGASGTTWRSGYFGTALYAPAIRPLSDSSTALLIQNAAGSTTILTINSSSNNVLIGNGTDGVTIGTTGITLTGTARPDVTITLSPEFQGAAFTGDGTNNNGSLSSDFCSGSSRQNINATACGATETHNYYNWTTTQASAQDYDIYVRYQLPSDYSTGSLSNMKIWGWGTTGASEEVTVAMYVDGTAAACATSSDVISSNTTWQQTTVASPLGSCTPVAGDMVTFRVHIAAGQNNNARAGAINISYKRAN